MNGPHPHEPRGWLSTVGRGAWLYHPLRKICAVPVGMAPGGIPTPPLLWYDQTMNAPLDVGVFRTTGRAAQPLDAREVRALDEHDLVLLQDEKGSKPPPIKRLGERHHALARCLASGMSDANAAITCGYDRSRVSILKADPAFTELLEFYRAEVTERYLDMHGVLAGLSVDAAMELRERLEADMQADDKTISIGQLMELTKLGADRTGFGPQSSTQNVNVNIDLAGRLEAARKRVEQRKSLPPPVENDDA